MLQLYVSLQLLVSVAELFFNEEIRLRLLVSFIPWKLHGNSFHRDIFHVFTLLLPVFFTAMNGNSGRNLPPASRLFLCNPACLPSHIDTHTHTHTHTHPLSLSVSTLARHLTSRNNEYLFYYSTAINLFNLSNKSDKSCSLPHAPHTYTHA